MFRADRTLPFVFIRDYVTRWDALALVAVLGLVALLAGASRGLLAPLSQLDATPMSLDPARLPEYAARTTLRMFTALGLSLVFTLTYATWAAKSPRAARVLVPLLDILQSVPILGFISITVVFFMSLAPGRVLGAEFAAIFAIFTSQAWNMAFSFYQSLRTVPAELAEAAASFHLTPWMRFWQLEVPFALPALMLEHDDVDVRRLVLRRRLRVDQRRPYLGRAAGNRLLHRPRDPAAKTSPPSAGRSAPWRWSSWSTTSCCSAR